MEIDIKQFGRGALRDTPDARDFQYQKICRAPLPFDWKKGVDIEWEIGDKLKIENQNGSSSCVGQAWAKYAEVLEMIENDNFIDLSAKDIYQRIYAPQGGAEIRLGGKCLVSLGVNKEIDVSSYENGNPPSENFMRTFTGGNPEQARVFSAKSYATVPASSIDYIACIIRDNLGCVSGFNGDNAGWGGAFVKPPKTVEWGHAVYFTGAKLINGKKYIKFINSWSDKWGDNGFGYFAEDYLSNMFSLWTLVDNNNLIFNPKKMTNTKLIKNGEEIAFYLPATNAEALKAMSKNYGIEIPLLPDGSVDWVKLKIDYTINN